MQKAIPNYEGIYEIDTNGNVWSYRIRGTRNLSSRLVKLSSRPDKDGYPTVLLTKDGQVKTCKVHRLVLLTFVGPCPEMQQVRHLDGCPWNCCLSNLVYGSAKQNQKDRKLHGTEQLGERSPNVKLTEKDVREIRDLATTMTQQFVADIFKVTQATVSQIVSRRIWKHVL